MEKRRRARINDCLTQLKTLVLQALRKDVSTCLVFKVVVGVLVCFLRLLFEILIVFLRLLFEFLIVFFKVVI